MLFLAFFGLSAETVVCGSEIDGYLLLYTDAQGNVRRSQIHEEDAALEFIKKVPSGRRRTRPTIKHCPRFLERSTHTSGENGRSSDCRVVALKQLREV